MTQTELRLRKLAREKRLAERRRWFRHALAAAMFPGIIIPFRPNLSAWWWRVDAGL